MEREQQISGQPEKRRDIESWRKRQYRKYILPLGICFVLGVAASATGGETYMAVNWEDIQPNVVKNEPLVNEGNWPEAADIGLMTVALGSAEVAGLLYFHKRALDKANKNNIHKSDLG